MERLPPRHMSCELDGYWAWCNASHLPIDPNMPLCIHFIYVDSASKSNHVFMHAPLLSRVTTKWTRHVAHLDSCRRTYRSHTIWQRIQQDKNVSTSLHAARGYKLDSTYYACAKQKHVNTSIYASPPPVAKQQLLLCVILRLLLHHEFM